MSKAVLSPMLVCPGCHDLFWGSRVKPGDTCPRCGKAELKILDKAR